MKADCAKSEDACEANRPPSGGSLGALGEKSSASLEEELALAKARLASMERWWPGVVFSQHPDLSFSAVTPNVETMTGIAAPAWLEKKEPFLVAVHEADVKAITHHLRLSERSQGVRIVTFRLRHRLTGRTTHVMEHRKAIRGEDGRLLGYEGLWLDVSRQVMAEKRLSTLAWKETLGILTTGLGHDFNNTLAGILSLSEAFEAQIDPAHPFFEGMSLIQKNTKQAIQLIRRLRSLHHWTVGERNYHDLNEPVADVVELVKRVAPKSITVESILADGQLPVYMDAVEFRQVAINLALNACQAMPRGGRLSLSTARYESYPELTHVVGTLPRLPAVCLAVKDEGCGIPPRHLDVLFEPFFTTKPLNQGSGLGLYNARLFVEKHLGAISVDSAERAGSTFRIWLPQADFTEADQQNEKRQSRRHTLLLVGEAEMPLGSTADLLRLEGYYVVVSKPGENSLDLLRSPDFEFSAVLLLLRRRSPWASELIRALGDQRGSLKTIVQTMGCDQDELDPEIVKSADLVIPPDLPERKILYRLHALLEDGAPPRI